MNGEDWQEHREQERKGKMDRQRWNSDVVFYLSGELDFPVKKIADHHLRLTHKLFGDLDYFPQTGRACWMPNKKRRAGKWFTIADIEIYLQKTFK